MEGRIWKRWSLATLFACTFTLFGCGGNVSSSDAGRDPRHEATLELIALYERLPENEHIKIHPQYGAWNNWQEQFTTAFSGNQEADLM